MKDSNKKFNKKGFTLIILPDDEYFLQKERIIKELAKSSQGIYINLEEKYEVVNKSLNGLEKKFFIIIRKTTSTKETENIKFLSSPSSLAELSLKIADATNSGKYKFLFFDSLDFLLKTHVSSIEVNSFMNYLKNHLEVKKLSFIGLMKEGARSNIFTQRFQNLADEVIGW